MNCYCVPNVVIVLNMLVKTILLLPLKFYCRDTAYEASCKGVAFVSQFVNFSRGVSNCNLQFFISCCTADRSVD